MPNKQAIPQAARRAVALAAGAVPGETTACACAYCGANGSITWPRLFSGRPGSWVSFNGFELDRSKGTQDASTFRLRMAA